MTSDRKSRSSGGIGIKSRPADRGPVWPISEISLKALDRLGVSDEEIAVSFGVSNAEVARLRHKYFGSRKRALSEKSAPHRPPDLAA